MVFEDIRRCDEHPIADFSDETELMQFVRASRWLAIDACGHRVLRINWVTALLAIFVLWGFSIASLVAPEDVLAEAKEWQSWVTQNFTWLYIGSQNAWVVFLLYLAFSKYGRIRLGRENERPEFTDISWFAMLFSCGIGVGIYYWGVSEPISYYRGGSLWKVPILNDDDRAQMAIFTALFHWGLHGWCAYIIVAVALGLVCYRWNMPLTMRCAFYPLLGNLIYSPLGDCIDALSIACTTFGVCTSLGFGVNSISAGLNKLNSDIEMTIENQIIIIWVITVVATVSISLGLRRGIQTLANITFAVGLFIVFCLLFMDNTWFLLNSFVQSCGHYFQWVIQVGSQTDTFQQLAIEFQAGGNLLWGSSGADDTGSLHGKMLAARAVAHANGATANLLAQSDVYGSHSHKWIDYWTVFYWGWWISWAPFVGMFIARISRGRTIRQVILGAFVAPTAFTFFWITTFGSLGIKMQRVAELALGEASAVDWVAGTVNCTMLGYDVDTKAPVSAAALDLAAEGYYALSCRAHSDRLFDVMAPYGEVTQFLILLCVVGVSLYFITSSDSGSYVDDIISANGLPNPPLVQKVFWAFTEGAVATGLVKAGGDDALGALQAVSICAGLPYTFALMFMCTSIWRGLKIDQEEDDILRSEQWSTGTLDIYDGFNPGPANETLTPRYGAAERLASLTKATFTPFVGVYKAAKHLNGEESGAAKVHGAFNAAFFLLWIIFLGLSAEDSKWAYVGWSWFMFFVLHVSFMRTAMRRAHGIYGNVWEDVFGCVCMYPNMVSQLELQAFEEHLAPGSGLYLDKDIVS